MTVRNEFAVHMLNAEGRERAQAIARDFDHLLGNLETVIGAGPSRSRPRRSSACGKLERGTP